MQTRLTVFPPGTNQAERRLLALHRDCPIVVASAALLSVLAVAAGWGNLGLMLVVVATAAAFAAVVSYLTRRIRRGIRRVDVVVTYTAGRRSVYGEPVLYESARRELERLESDYRAGHLLGVQFEAGWSRVYDQLATRRQSGRR